MAKAKAKHKAKPVGCCHVVGQTEPQANRLIRRRFHSDTAYNCPRSTSRPPRITQYLQAQTMKLLYSPTFWAFKFSTAAVFSILIWNWKFRFAEETIPPVSTQLQARVPAEDIFLFSPKFSCGGGPFSNTMASLVSFPCDVEEIHVCCLKHDQCYDDKIDQTSCDTSFCNCLAQLPWQGQFCEVAAHKGLCLATHLFGHMFYEGDEANNTMETTHLLT
ncbi:unnamed protein product [Bursaphelenchus okinawaensis]|uniref:Phospholipase A(2) n=1 Tax=Bursaphelenchus okinawaensis TaxID=465554 RepID=A0A811JVQ1_9BILA|nr:unnamed protein product [Bursaphelenchus okinawaensis]CAG9085157.1 unnamed protein product [Bursaphelenchus okinawaensis]